MSEKFLCVACKKLKGKEVFMIERHDMLVCPECKTAFFVRGKSPLGRYIENWGKNAEELFPLLRPPFYQQELTIPKLFFLYEDCYHTLLVGKYNAAIVLMGVLLEALVKERIFLKLGKDFREPFGACLKLIEDKRLMDVGDIHFLRNFKDKIRNPYQHVDNAQILQGVFVPVWPLEFKEGLSLEKIEKALEKAKSGQLKPWMLPAAEIPAIRSVVKQEFDRRQAIRLFNEIYDFLLVAQVKYFKKEEYDEHHKKFKTGLEGVKHFEV